MIPKKISENIYEIAPDMKIIKHKEQFKNFEMKVPARIYANEYLMQRISKDKSIDQIVMDLIRFSNTSFSTEEFIFGVNENKDFYFTGISSFIISSMLFIRLLYFYFFHNFRIPDFNFSTWMITLMMSIQFTLFAMWFDKESNKDLR